MSFEASMTQYGKIAFTPIASIMNVSVCDVKNNPGFAYIIRLTGKSFFRHIQDCPFTVSYSLLL
jgi:hypothetical protein